MVDTYGRWNEEEDYSTYPEEKWCDYDTMAAWIREHGYEPKTSMDNHNMKEKLRVRWTTQLGCSMKRFYVPVKNIQDGLKIIDLLSEYDTFRLKKIVKPDYNHIGVFELYVYGKWIPVYINEDGYDYKISFTHRGNSSVVQILENFGRQLYGQTAFKLMDEWMEKYGYKYNAPSIRFKGWS